MIELLLDTLFLVGFLLTCTSAALLTAFFLISFALKLESVVTRRFDRPCRLPRMRVIR